MLIAHNPHMGKLQLAHPGWAGAQQLSYVSTFILSKKNPWHLRHGAWEAEVELKT
jgi:hypothetical protein